MSLVALLGGGGIYYHRRRLFNLQKYFPGRDESRQFDDLLKRLQQRLHGFLTAFDNDSLQRAVFWLFFVALMFSMIPLMRLNMNVGVRPQIPVDFVMLAGATLLGVSSVATVIWHQQRLLAVLLLSVVGLVVSIAFALFSAPDLALTQLSVEVVTVVLLLLALHFLPRQAHSVSSPNRVVRDLFLAVLIGGVVGTITFALTTRPLESISGYYIENAKALGGGTNIVNVILVDFRGFDTFGEISVLAIAAMGISLLLERMRPFHSEADHGGPGWAAEPHPMMLAVVSKAVLPLAIMVSIYIFFRGHNLPGGGFIAGLITSVALIQQYIALGSAWMNERLSINYLYLIGSGLLIAAVTGAGSFLWGQPFLKSWHGHFHLSFLGDIELASAMAFDLGVYLTVVGACMMILSKLGHMKNPSGS